ncbi:hypothetical protein F4859DRAFT_508638 [Xylaria cf. heliscus]|nr:hypothetical protein F4859DRAFT_508638 [Xylaria cf. heliscus]
MSAPIEMTSVITEEERSYTRECQQGIEVPIFTTLYPRPYLKGLSTLLSTTCSSNQNYGHRKTLCNHQFVDIVRLDRDDIIAQGPESLTLEGLRELPHDVDALLFLRGEPCSDLLRALGAKFQVDYDVLSEHLPSHEEYVCERPRSGPARTFRLRLPILGSRWASRRKTDPVSYAELDNLRQVVDATVSEYSRSVAMDPTAMCGGASIVRNVVIHDEQYFSIDQYVTVHICQRESGWIGIVWADPGYSDWRYTGNLISHFGRLNKDLKTYPIINLPFSDVGNNTAGLSDLPPTRLPQTALVGLQNYGNQIDTSLLHNDRKTSLFPLIHLCLAAESQHLRIIETTLGKGAEDISLVAPRVGLSIVLETKKHLQSHLHDFRNVEHFLRTLALEHSGTVLPETDFILSVIGKILDKIQCLISECNDTVSYTQALGSLQQAERAISEARGVKLLTVLAFFFAPISFTTSFFGMNFKEFGTGTLSLWVWAVAAVPISLLFAIPFTSDFYNIGKLVATALQSILGWIRGDFQ